MITEGVLEKFKRKKNKKPKKQKCWWQKTQR